MKLPKISSGVFNGTVSVLENRQVSPSYRRIRVRVPGSNHAVSPGQFAHIGVTDGNFPLLRRPFSYHDVEGNEVEFLYKVVGTGTKRMAQKQEGDQLKLLGPLGQPFTPPSNDVVPVLIGGGVGIPPIHLFSQKLTKQNWKEQEIKVFIGAQKEEDLLELQRFQGIGCDLYVSTDDGSKGFEGVVTDHFRNEYRHGDLQEIPSLEIFGCGPEGMLEAIRTLALELDLPAEICIERQMGCALGVCRACVVKVKDPETDRERVATTCREGPVFDVRKLCPDWA